MLSFHATTKQHCRYTTSVYIKNKIKSAVKKNTAISLSHNHIWHESSESVDSREQLYMKAINDNAFFLLGLKGMIFQQIC